MKKNEYVSPEMEIVEIAEQCSILAGSNDNEGGGQGGPGGLSRGGVFDDED